MSDGADIAPLLTLPPGPERTAALASWLQALYPPEVRRPILVGGAAVELYTGGAYTTGDLDFVGSAPPAVAKALEQSGFRRVGRHWLNETGQVFLEFPGGELEPSSAPVDLVFDGHPVTIIPIEGLLADRLAAWKFWRSGVDAVNALLLLRSDSYSVDLKAARRLARQLEVDDELERLLRWNKRLGGRQATRKEIEEWLEKGRKSDRR